MYPNRVRTVKGDNTLQDRQILYRKPGLNPLIKSKIQIVSNQDNSTFSFITETIMEIF